MLVVLQAGTTVNLSTPEYVGCMVVATLWPGMSNRIVQYGDFFRGFLGLCCSEGCHATIWEGVV